MLVQVETAGPPNCASRCCYSPINNSLSYTITLRSSFGAKTAAATIVVCVIAACEKKLNARISSNQWSVPVNIYPPPYNIYTDCAALRPHRSRNNTPLSLVIM